MTFIILNIYINDLDDNITSNVLKFDTKVFRKVNTGGDKQHLQNDLHSILGKCKCLHTGHGNLDVNNKMGDTVLGTTVTESFRAV